MRIERPALYYCPGCRQTIYRDVMKRTKYRMSECAKAGRKIRMRLLKRRPTILV